MAGCCAVGTCETPGCYLCTVIARLPQPKHHADPVRDTTKPTRDGEFVRIDRTKQRRHRAGPLWVPRHRRVTYPARGGERLRRSEMGWACPLAFRQFLLVGRRASADADYQ